MIFHYEPMMNLWTYRLWIYADMSVFMKLLWMIWGYFENKVSILLSKVFSHTTKIMIVKGIYHLWVYVGEINSSMLNYA